MFIGALGEVLGTRGAQREYPKNSADVSKDFVAKPFTADEYH